MNLDNLKKDSIFYPLYQKFGEDYIFKAGFFENKAANSCISDEDLIKSLDFLTTTLPSISDVKDNSCVILSTGCYNPIHEDHVNLMVEAKLKLESEGYHVIAGYLAPDSDDYVKVKSKDYLNINQRIVKVIEACKEYDWLHVDPWAGLYAGTDVNFTTIYKRLQFYFERYVKHLPIFYVCGSDRGSFSYAFEDKAVVVERYNENRIDSDIHPMAYYAVPSIKLNKSSTEARKTWNIQPVKKTDVILRVDNNVNNELYNNLINLFKEHFNTVTKNLESDQKIVFDDIVQETVSLDSLLKNKYSLEISRFYNFGNEFIKYDNRIGTDSIDKQLNRIPKDKQLYIFDDDSFTGGTLRFANDLLKNHCIVGNITLVKSNDKIEVLDLRDFTFGSNNGLSLMAPNGDRFRVPYIMPFVNPFIMASIIHPIEFSKKAWEINYNHYIKNDMNIEDSNDFNCLKYIGFTGKVSEACKYFMEKL